MSEKIWDNENVKIETMTVAECVQALQKMGVKTSPLKLRAGISQGVYPFGVCIDMKEREFEIYSSLFYKWVEERASFVGV